MRRREHFRYDLWFPVQVQAGGDVKIAMNQNIGIGGVLVAVCAELKVDEIVTLTFSLPTGDGARVIAGRIVRIEPNTDDPDGEWPFKVGIAFDEVAPDLIPFLESAVARLRG